MALEKNIKLKVTADTTQADANLKKVDSGIAKISSSLKSITALAGVGFGVAFLKDSVSQYIEAERVAAKLDSTLKRNTKSLQDYASSLQNQTRFEDDAIINGMALIGMFVKDEEQIKKLTQATLDLASAKQMDLTTAFDLVSKTAGSSTNALSRYGIEVEGAAGSNERATNTFEAINKIMGGSSKAEKDTTYGKLESLKNSFGDLQKSLASGFIPALSETISLLNNLISLNWEGLYFNLKNIGQGFTDFITGQSEFKKQLQEMIKNQGTIGGTVLGGLIGDRNSLQQTIDKYKSLNNEHNNSSNIIEKMNKGFENESELLSMLGDVLDTLTEKYKRFLIAQKMIAEGTYWKGKLNINKVSQPDKPGLGFSDSEVMSDFARENSFYIEQMRAGLLTLQDEFSKFWNDIFGEANSLLEKFLETFANGLFELGSRTLIGSFLDFIPGGEFLKPFLSTNTGGKQIINVNIGNETVERVIVNGIKSAQQKRLL